MDRVVLKQWINYKIASHEAQPSPAKKLRTHQQDELAVIAAECIGNKIIVNLSALFLDSLCNKLPTLIKGIWCLSLFRNWLIVGR